MSRTVLLTLVALAVLLVTASGSFAQNGSNIAGVVKDTTGAVLPGVTVEASSPALIEKVRTVVTDGSGQYKIIDVRPGTYAVTFTLTGFNTVKRDGIELPASFTATVNADLRVGSVTETITVSGEAPTVDVQNVTQQRVMTHDLLDATPVGSKVAAAVGVFIPGIVVSSQDVGGTQSTALGTLAIHGGRSGEMLILMDGMDASNGQGRGGAYTTVEGNDAAITEMSLQTSALTAESELGGVVTNIIPRDGGNTFKGSAFGAYTNNSLQGSNLTPRLVALGALRPTMWTTSTTSIQVSGARSRRTRSGSISLRGSFQTDSSRLDCFSTRAPSPISSRPTSVSRPTKRPSTATSAPA